MVDVGSWSVRSQAEVSRWSMVAASLSILDASTDRLQVAVKSIPDVVTSTTDDRVCTTTDDQV
jgi:hypothetical protein